MRMFKRITALVLCLLLLGSGSLRILASAVPLTCQICGERDGHSEDCDHAEATTAATEETQPSAEATEPSIEVTEPSTEATEPSTEATEPSTEATEPSTEATEPSTESTEPSTEATEPSTEATEPSTEVTEPTEPVTEPTAPVKEPSIEVRKTFSSAAPFLTGSDRNSRVSTFGGRSSAGTEQGSIVLNKWSEATGTWGNERFKLTLESYATGTEGTLKEVPVPNDIVLVLDESGSMDDCIECNHEIYHGAYPAHGVTTKGNVTDPSRENNTVLFTGHKIFGADIWTYKEYKVIYPVDGSTRIVRYCEKCEAWYSNNSSHFGTGATHTGWGKWTPFTKENQKPEVSSGTEYVVQFYCVCDHDTTRNMALTNALKGFVKELYADSVGDDGTAGTDDDVENRIAIVGYGSGVRYYTSTNESNRNGTALRTIATPSERDALIGIVENLLKNEATNTAAGIQAAEGIFAANPIGPKEDRNRVMILFTDGAPGSGYVYYDGSNGRNDWTNPGIASAKAIKNTYGATVYTVGLFPGADASNPGRLPAHTAGSGADGQHNPKFFENANRFLHLVSSNYPAASGMGTSGTVNSALSGDSHYLSTENEQGLYDIFDALSKVVEPGTTTVTLDGTTVLKDIVTPYFTVAEAVAAWTEEFCGYESDGVTRKWGNKANVSSVGSGNLTVKVDGRTITVTGFDFAENYVGTNKDEQGNDVYRGKRLMVEIVIIPNADFLGGNLIDTNLPESGLYTEETMVEKFPVPNEDVKVKDIVPIGAEKDIYVSQQVDLPDAVNLGEFTVNGTTYPVDGINNAYVDIVYTLKDADGKTTTCTIPAGVPFEAMTDRGWDETGGLGIHPIPENDRDYTVTCQVVSINDREDNKSGLQKGTIAVDVYKPVITFRDSAIDLGDTADYAAENVVSVVWKHGDTPANAAAMGVAPTLEYAYDPAEAAFQKETSVTVTKVTAKGNDSISVPADMEIIGHVTFRREGCAAFPGCPHTQTAIVPGGGVNFVVHLKNFDLKIIKDVTGGYIDPNQSFLFHVTGPNSFSMNVMVVGEGSVIIKGLPAGVYTVTELTDWSWRYDCSDPEKTVSAEDAVNGISAVTFHNTREEEYWLSGDCVAENQWTDDRVSDIYSGRRP